MRNTLARICIFTSVFAVAACGVSEKSVNSKVNEEWNNLNDPLNMGGNYQRNLAKLPTSASLNVMPWADSYWPSYKAGIAQRWTNNDDFSYSLANINKLKTMTLQELAGLSPAEKLDIANSNYDYPTVHKEWRRTSPDRPKWEGICHGWAPASLIYKEPKPSYFTNKDGIKIPFGSSDVKALLSYFLGQEAKNYSVGIGQRCNIDLSKYPNAANNPECRDTNAGAFHIVLTNYIGIQQKGFVADITKDAEVWNHPVYAYSYKVLNEVTGASQGAAPGTVSEATIETAMDYRVESNPIWDATGLNPSFSKRKVYKYVVELNARHEIIGGRWLTSDRPDFLWNKELAAFTGNYAVLDKIYSNSIGVVEPMPDTNSDEWLQIVNANSGLCLDINSTIFTSEGADVVQSKCNRKSSQFFRIISGTQFQVKSSGKCLQIKKGIFGIKLEQRECLSTIVNGQLFKLEDAEDGAKVIRELSLQKNCLTILDGSKSTGARVTSTECTGNSTQKFYFKK